MFTAAIEWRLHKDIPASTCRCCPKPTCVALATGRIIESKTSIVEWPMSCALSWSGAASCGPGCARLRVPQRRYRLHRHRVNSIWHRLMKAAVKARSARRIVVCEPILVDGFTLPRLRTKQASNSENILETNDAIAKTTRTTQKAYRRKTRRARAGAKILDSRRILDTTRPKRRLSH